MSINQVISLVTSPKVTILCNPCSTSIRPKGITKDVLAEDIEDHPPLLNSDKELHEDKDEKPETTVRFACPLCNLLFTRSTAVTRHVRAKHIE